jgi:DNA topoisomerase VI subunit B
MIAQRTLERTTFTTSRVMEFFTEKELQMQIGHSRDWWPIALVKELIDNALDACERAGISPKITIRVEHDAVSIQDNGPGLPLATLRRSLDYLVRVSDKAYYVSPTRGQLGNALKCVWAAPFVINGQRGRVDVETAGTRYQIEAQVDFITQKPHISIADEPSDVKNGTLVTMYWPGIPRFLISDRAPSFYNAPELWQVLCSYAAFNPHAAFAIETEGYKPAIWEATDHSWAKWLPSQPTSPHWYTPDRLRALIAGYLSSDLSNDRSRTIREFISEFAGLSGTAKQKAIADRAGLSGATLRDMVQGNDVSIAACRALLEQMQAEARAVKPQALGALGEQHLRNHMATRRYVQAESIRYKKAEGECDGLPFVIEVCFGIYGRDYQELGRNVSVGLNWAPSISAQPIHDLSTILGEQRVDSFDPVVVLVHLACPRFEYLDRGKTIVSLPGAMKAALTDAIASVTKDWKRAKKQADTNERVRERDLERLRQTQRAEKPTIKDACYRFLEEVYNEVSEHGNYAAPKRMIMYGLRDRVLQIETREPWNHTSTPKYVTQSVIRDFLEDFPELTADWNIVGDDRGHMIEPHTGATIGLGGIAVRDYVR